MDRICFVVGLYGEEVNGGAEKHCKMLAERAAAYFDVEVLTSTANNYTTFTPFYAEGKTEINGVTIRRFQSINYDAQAYKVNYKKSRINRKIRRLLFNAGLLNPVASLLPKWNLNIDKELSTLRSHGLYSPDLIEFIHLAQDNYKAIFLLSYPCPNFYDINRSLSNKTILIPTAHYEGDFFRAYLSHIFTQTHHIAFNTEKERELCYAIFGTKMATNSILAVGTEIVEGTSRGHIDRKFALPKRYILYFGRIAKEKVGNLIDWFLEFKSASNSPVKLVLTGGLFMDRYDHPEIIYTGFVSEAEKTALIQNCELVVNPSDRESLSLLLLETMQLGKPSLVNGKSAVLKQHCIDSDYASCYYVSKADFIQKLDSMLTLISQEHDDNKLGKKAIAYVEENYSWETILQRLVKIVNTC